jgi:hypothetical protein
VPVALRAYCNICNGVVAPNEPSPWICSACTNVFNHTLGYAEWPKLIHGLEGYKGYGSSPQQFRRYSPDAPIVPELAVRIADAESQSLKLAIGLAQRRQEVSVGTGKAPHWESVKAPKRTRLCDD